MKMEMEREGRSSYFEHRADQQAKSKTALDAIMAVKRIEELVEGGMDRRTAELQVIWGIYTTPIPPIKIPRPGCPSVNELHAMIKDANSIFSLLKNETSGIITSLEEEIERQEREQKTS